MKIGYNGTGFLSVYITARRIYQTDTVASHDITKSSEATSNPVYELEADKLQPVLINMLFRLGLLRPPDFFNRLTVRKKTG